MEFAWEVGRLRVRITGDSKAPGGRHRLRIASVSLPHERWAVTSSPQIGQNSNRLAWGLAVVLALLLDALADLKGHGAPVQVCQAATHQWMVMLPFVTSPLQAVTGVPL